MTKQTALDRSERCRQLAARAFTRGQALGSHFDRAQHHWRRWADLEDARWVFWNFAHSLLVSTK